MENEVAMLSTMQTCKFLLTVCFIGFIFVICDRQSSQIAGYKVVNNIQKNIIKDLRKERKRKKKDESE